MIDFSKYSFDFLGWLLSNGHPWWTLLGFALFIYIISEIVYAFIIKGKERPRDKTINMFVFDNKIIAISWSLLGSAVLTILMDTWYIFLGIALILGVLIGLGILYFKHNKAIALKLTKLEPQEAFEKRIKELNNKFKFKVGQKVKVIKQRDDSHLKNGDISIVESRELDDENDDHMPCYYLQGTNRRHYEWRLQAVKKRGKSK